MAIKREDALILHGQRRMTGGKMIDGRIWLELDGKKRIELTPHSAFELAKGILRNLGYELEIENRFVQ